MNLFGPFIVTSVINKEKTLTCLIQLRLMPIWVMVLRLVVIYINKKFKLKIISTSQHLYYNQNNRHIHYKLTPAICPDLHKFCLSTKVLSNVS